ncbi:unnamed protein product [Cuscuta campestris]|uniref:mannan endo-1,4-beta-mannosidase n=1 Tax=Cuscuta campestris TaxID=132261 RepID=A0A484KAF3_9ASTE|nr:unnamed protein product [Cuscuta campestris]
MAAFVKSIDNKHLLEIGLEGFYGKANDARNQGLAFQLSGRDDAAQLSFMGNWINTHIYDAQKILKKPVVVAEFGMNSSDPGFSVHKRDVLFATVYSAISGSAKGGGAASGGLFWQLFTEGMRSFNDGYEVILSESATTAEVIRQQSEIMGQLSEMHARVKKMEEELGMENNNTLSVKTIKGHNNHNGMVRINGTQLMLNGIPFKVNGFKAYWPLFAAAEPSQRSNVGAVFDQARNHGLNVLRTLAFGEGGKNHPPLQIEPGHYNRTMLEALDYVVSAAGEKGMKVILSLADNWKDYGGMEKYVEWVHGGEKNLSAELFFSDYKVKEHFKNHVQAILTRNNSISGVMYKDDPTIMAWELINEPRCKSDLSGNTLQKWIEEMANFTKTIDENHLLEIGLEGFYGQQNPKKNLGSNNGFHQFGTDFIRNNQIPGIDFATVHAYPDAWLGNKTSEEEQLSFLKTWMDSHFEDANEIIKKPILVAEFGKSSKDAGFTVEKRDKVFTTVYLAISNSTRVGGAAAGGLFWQLSIEGMDAFYDGYHVILNQSPSTAEVIKHQSSVMPLDSRGHQTSIERDGHSLDDEVNGMGCHGLWRS